MIFELRGELVDSFAKEEVMMLFVEATLTNGLQEVRRDIECLQVLESGVLHGLTDDTRPRAYIKADSLTADAHSTLFNALDALVDDMLWLGEVDDAGPLVVALGSEASVPLGDVLLLGQIIIELVDDMATFLRLSLTGVSFTRWLLDHVVLFLLLEFLNLCHCVCASVFDVLECKF